jgi:L-ascorbate metabolism protein UlaG (beta-lactamase superfamily)
VNHLGHKMRLTRISMLTLRQRARQFGRLVKRSVIERRAGQIHRPVLAAKSQLGVTFIGHSGFFLQMSGKNILIDPNFARWLFLLKRLRNPGISIGELPPIDYVLITHAHFDHLNRPSLRRIARLTRRLTGRAPTLIVPRNVKDVVRYLGFKNVVELGWWDECHDGNGGLTVTHVPARHWGARMIRDNYRGFGGYVLRDGKHSVYHAGDTAYFKGFEEIGRRLKPEIALLPIGAYHPESFRNVHTSPEDALQGFIDLGARWMVPMHYGSFRLSHEPMEEPTQRLRAAAKAAGVSDKVIVMEEGVTRFF